MAKAGRPPKTFTKAQEKTIADLALDNCNTRTIAEAIGADKDTLLRHYGPLIKKKRAEHRIMVRQMQSRLLRQGDKTMAVWLGKNALGQTDKAEISGNAAQPLRLVIELAEAPGGE